MKNLLHTQTRNQFVRVGATLWPLVKSFDSQEIKKNQQKDKRETKNKKKQELLKRKSTLPCLTKVWENKRKGREQIRNNFLKTEKKDNS